MAAIPELPEELALQGALFSIDAIACSAKTAEILTRKGGHYMLSLKKNQRQLYEQLSEYMVKQKEALPRFNGRVLAVTASKKEFVMYERT